VKKFSKSYRVDTPTGKHQLAQLLMEKVKSWEQPVLIHESLRKLADLLKVPPEVIQVGPSMAVRREGHASPEFIDADKILETDLLRLLFLSGESGEALIKVAKANLKPEQLKVPICRKLYELVIQGDKVDLLTCAGGLEQEEEGDLVLEMMKRKINPDKALEALQATLKRILERNWLEERERIKLALHSGSLSEEEALEMAKKFTALQKQIPQLSILN